MAIGSQLNEFLNDVRLLLPYIYLADTKHFFDNVMFITMAPADEYNSNLDFTKYELSRHMFSKKKRSFMKESHTPEQVILASNNGINMQRKMNPESALCTKSSIAEAEASVNSYVSMCFMTMPMSFKCYNFLDVCSGKPYRQNS